MNRLSVIGLCLVLDVAAASAQGHGADVFDRDESHGAFQLDVHTGFMFYGRGLSAGVRFGIPIVKRGFLTKNDALYLQFGADMYFIRYRHQGEWDYGPGLGFPILAHWELYFTTKASAFFEVGGNVFLHPGVFRDEGDFILYRGAWFLGAVGIHYRFGRNIGFVARAGTPYCTVGLGFEF